MECDIIVSWPRNADYPLWREFIRANRHRFNKVIIVFTQSDYNISYQSFIMRVMAEDNITFLNNIDWLELAKDKRDWRDSAINIALKYSVSDWVWFTEQDFIISNINYWKHVDLLSIVNQSIGVYQAERLHPCCLFLHKNILSKIKKDFSANPPEYDHFGKIQIELNRNQILTGIIPSDTYHHMNGLSHNWRLIQDGQKPIYEVDEFNKWLIYSKNVIVPINKVWLDTVNNYLNTIGI